MRAGYESSPLRLSDDVAAARAAGTAVVALETTLVTHGFAYPRSVEVARAVEDAVRSAGATPATIGVIGGHVCVGLDARQLEQLARGPADKIQARGLPLAVARGSTGGTTVSATLHVAALCGIRVFATGGIGGVHREAERTGDVSEDLLALARYPAVVVSSGAKAILDLPRTVEMLETLGVPVVGCGTSEFPAFYHGTSGVPLQAVETPRDIAALARCAWEGLALHRALLVCQPPPAHAALAAADVERWLAEALADARARGVTGAALTPCLLAALDRLSRGATVATNAALIAANATLGARIARELARITDTSQEPRAPAS